MLRICKCRSLKLGRAPELPTFAQLPQEAQSGQLQSSRFRAGLRKVLPHVRLERQRLEAVGEPQHAAFGLGASGCSLSCLITKLRLERETGSFFRQPTKLGVFQHNGVTCIKFHRKLHSELRHFRLWRFSTQYIYCMYSIF